MVVCQVMEHPASRKYGLKRLPFDKPGFQDGNVAIRELAGNIDSGPDLRICQVWLETVLSPGLLKASPRRLLKKPRCLSPPQRYSLSLPSLCLA